MLHTAQTYAHRWRTRRDFSYYSICIDLFKRNWCRLVFVSRIRMIQFCYFDIFIKLVPCQCDYYLLLLNWLNYLFHRKLWIVNAIALNKFKWKSVWRQMQCYLTCPFELTHLISIRVFNDILVTYLLILCLDIRHLCLSDWIESKTQPKFVEVF